MASESGTLWVAFVGTFDTRRLDSGAIVVRLSAAHPYAQVRSCTSQEGLHLTAWSGTPLTSQRLWHQYYYLGYDVEPSCDDREVREAGDLSRAPNVAGLAAGELAAQTTDLPGSDPPLEFSCAAFPAPVSESWLIERFGAENVVTDSIIGADDGPVEGTVVYRSLPERSLDVAWQDPNIRTTAAWIRSRGDSRWLTSHGFGVGADLLSVERANGWPFRLQGFVGEGSSGGTVLSWGQGRFASADPDGSCGELITFQHSYDGSVDATLLRQVGRIREVSSGHPAMQQINPRVVAVWLRYRRQ
jgi:hypothetical protein